jgi:protein SCO1/2
MQTWRVRHRSWAAALVAALSIAAFLAPAGCRRSGRQYPLRGQIVAVNPARQELTIKHDDIPGFMPGMTMAFKVSEPKQMQGRTEGELVTATLVVSDRDARLRDIVRTGFGPIADPTPSTRVMDLIEPGRPVRDASLRDEAGTPRRLADWRGRVLAVTFMYTRCPMPDFCPAMDRHFKAVQEQVRADPRLRDQVQLLSVSFDPEHDSPAVLAGRAADLGADPAIWHFLTGDREEVDSFASQFGVSISRNPDASAEIVHNLRTAVIDGEGKLVTTLSGSEWAPPDLVAEIRRARARR